MLNRRHKSILFFTLVFTGSSLLVGVSLSEGIGFLMLGFAFAWLVGSDTAKRAYQTSRRIPGKLWGSLRLIFWLALAGCLMASLAVATNFNAFLVGVALSLLGLFIAPYQQAPTANRAVKVVVWIVAITAFLFAAVAVAGILKARGDSAERIGELAFTALMALLIGMTWLVRGWKLVLLGISPYASTGVLPTEEHVDMKPKGTLLLYVSLVAGVVVLSLVLGLRAFSAFSDSTSPWPTTITASQQQNSAFYPYLILMLLAWWPYKCWEEILNRQPNRSAHRLRLHKAVTMALGAVFTIPVCVGAVFGVQNGQDRITTAQIENSAKDFQAVAQKIGAIKSRDFKTTEDYIEGYGEIDPLLTDFNTKLKHFDEIVAESERVDKSRGPLNIQRLYASRKNWENWDAKSFALVHRDNQLTRQQIEAIKQMASLPPNQQVTFWKESVQPLLQQEDEVRVKMASLMKEKPGN